MVFYFLANSRAKFRYLNIGDYKKALSYFQKFPDSKEASYYIEKLGGT